jgi:hypothetical protein
MRKILKWTGIVLSIPIALVLLLSVLLYIPFVQDFAVRTATEYASEATGMEIHISRIRLHFPLNLVVKDVQVISEADTLLDVGRLQVDVQFLPLLRQQVEVDGIHLQQAKVNTLDLITTMQLKASLGNFDLVSHGVSLDTEEAILNAVNLKDADVLICLKDTVDEDTTETEVNWKIRLLKSRCENVRFAMQMSDTTSVAASLEQLLLQDAHIDLGNSAYELTHLVLKGGTVNYDADTLTAKAGLDPSHIAIRQMNLDLDSIYYDPQKASLLLTAMSMQERSGLALLSAKGAVRSDSVRLSVPRFSLQTGDSYAEFSANVPWKSLEAQGKERMSARFLAELGKNDLMAVLGDMPQAFVRTYPNAPIELRAGVDGNMKALHVTGLQAHLEGAFEASMEGTVEQVLDSLNRSGNLQFALRTEDLNFVTALADSTLSDTYRIPSNLLLNGECAVAGNQYNAGFDLADQSSTVSLEAAYNATTEAYKLDLNIDSLRIDHFLPKDSMYALTAAVQWEGAGLDPYAAHTHTKLKASLDHLDYGHWQLRNFDLDASLLNHEMKMSLLSDNQLLKLRTALEGYLDKQRGEAMLDVHLEEANLYAMQVTENEMAVGADFHLNAKTDWKKDLTLKGYLQQLKLQTPKKTYYPKDLFFETFTTADSTYATVRAGDLRLTMEGGDYVEALMNRVNGFLAAVDKQVENRDVRPDVLRSDLPPLCLKVQSGKDNPVSNFLAMQGVSYEELFIDMDTSPEEGVNGKMHLYALHNDSILLDTIRFKVEQDSATVRFALAVHNAVNKKHPAFDAHVDGSFDNQLGQIRFRYFDEEKNPGMDLGIGMEWKEEGMRFHFFPDEPIIGFQNFTLNEGNHVWLYKGGAVEGEVSMLNKQGMGFRFYSVPNEESNADLTFELSKINIGQILSVVPFAPDIRGTLDTEIHYLKNGDNFSLAAETTLDSLSYEQCYIGHLTNSSIYMPKEDNTHYVDTRFSLEDEEIFALAGNYQDVGEGSLDMDMTLQHFPLQVVNGFIPDHMIAFTGDVDGTMCVAGTPSRPLANGEVMLDSVTLSSEMYGVKFLFDERPVTVNNSRVKFDNFSIYTKPENPFTMDGTVDFANLERIALDLRMRAKDFELLNATRTRSSLLDGKLIVDFFSTLKGRLDDLKMEGMINVQAKTDVTYLLKDTPISVEDQLSDLVTFVNFKDSTQVEKAEKKQYASDNMEISMKVSVAQGAEIRIDLSEDRHSYVELQGGGDLTMKYSQGNLSLIGKYTLTGGEMKYELPVIPLKTFTIQDGSYVQFDGDIMNPTMNISASERMRASVSEDNVSRNVSFDVGVNITNTVANMGLEFTLAAPEDMTMQNELAAMSKEERGKLAVSMLVTGLYLGGNGTSGGFNANNALNSFLQSEISNIAGSALKSVDISLGVEDNTSSDGSSRTDYSFRFAKRFWGDKLSIIIGGTVSSGGSSADNTNNSFIDNVSLEYRLDDSSTRYIRLFHNKNYESILEGEITETGVGVVLRRKMTKLGELFIFSNKKKKNAVPEPQQTVKAKDL